MSPRKKTESTEESFDVRAAGGLIFRGSLSDPKLAIVHRPRYDDWTFPKGKAEPGEADEETAYREVLEETGFECELGRELPSVTYRDHKDRSKIVRYWVMSVLSGAFEPNEEVDVLEWVSAIEAGERLTYDHDVDVLSAFLSLVHDE